MVRQVMFTVSICVLTVLSISGVSAVYDGINYQGQLMVNGAPFDGTGHFMFAVLDRSSTQYHWSNDGFFPPITYETVLVENGLFNVILGEPDMEPFLSTEMLSHSDLLLRIWFDNGTTGMQLLTPDQKLTSTVYAGRSSQSDTADDADTVDGYDYSVLWPTTLTTVKAAASNDFHNLGGTDDDIPDSLEVSSAAIQNDAVNVDKLAHNINATTIGFNADQVDGYHYSVLWPTTLTTVKAAASNDFHNLGGTDDDIPDYGEVSSSAIQNDAVNADKLAHNIDATSIGFNADKVDGMDASNFASLSHDHWGEEWSGSDLGLRLSGGTRGLSAAGSSYGILGETDLSDGYGVYGRSNSLTGQSLGIYGYNESTSGIAIYGYAAATSGTTRGIYGKNASTTGSGIFGSASSATGTTSGVHGLSLSSTGRGIYGQATSTTGSTQGVYGYVNSDAGRALYGFASSSDGETYGVWGQTTSDEGIGVYGYSTSFSGSTYGVFGKSRSSSGVGVYGECAASGTVYGVRGKTVSSRGTGVFGESTSLNGTATGVRGTTSSTEGFGVHGSVTAATGTSAGMYGVTSSTTGKGVHGNALTSTGLNYGVYGESASNSGYGVYGSATSTSGYVYGVYGKTDSSVGRGVFGRSTANNGLTYGVYGLGDSTNGAGVLAQNYYTGAALQAFSFGNSIEGYYGEPSSSYLRYFVDSDGFSYADGGHHTFKRTGKITDGKEECHTMSAISSPEVWFEDFGLIEFTGKKIKVHIDPDFADMANLEVTYHVFLTQEGGFCPLYIAERTPDYFIIRTDGNEDCQVSVHYRLVAKRLGSEDHRMETILLPQENKLVPSSDMIE